MAGIAGKAGRDVRCGFRARLGGCIGAIVAGRALPRCDARVAHCRRSECRSVMADVALEGSRNVIGRLAKSAASRHMATRVSAVGYEAGVIRFGRQRPTYRARMASIALGRRRDMCRRFHLRVLRQIGTAMTG